jgi:hypothetical protein
MQRGVVESLVYETVPLAFFVLFLSRCAIGNEAACHVDRMST